MSKEDAGELDSEIREIFARADAGRHPPSEMLAAYAGGDLGEAATEPVQAHLGSCRECTAAVLALEFPRLEATAERLPNAEVAEGIEAIVSRVVPGRTRPGRTRSPRWALLAAAVLALACSSLVLLTVRLEQRVGELEDALRTASAATTLPASAGRESLPQAGVPIIDLYPPSVARGEAAEPPPVPLDAGASMVALILNPPSGLSHDAYGLRILDAADAELWSGPARPGEAGAFVLVLPRRFAEAADRIVLYGKGGGSDQPLETYRVRFE